MNTGRKRAQIGLAQVPASARPIGPIPTENTKASELRGRRRLQLDARHRQPRPRRRRRVVAARPEPERRDARERVVGEALGVEERGDDGVLRRHGGGELAERGVLVLAQRDELRRRAEVEDLDLGLLRRAERRLGADRRACAEDVNTRRWRNSVDAGAKQAK